MLRTTHMSTHYEHINATTQSLINVYKLDRGAPYGWTLAEVQDVMHWLGGDAILIHAILQNCSTSNRARENDAV